MKEYIVRDGQVIVKHGMCQDSDLVLQAAGTEVVVENTGSWNSADHYYDGSNFVARPGFTLAPSASSITTAQTLTVTGIPVGTIVLFPGGQETVDDGEIEWDSLVAGTYTLEFKNFPYIEEAINVEVTDV